MEAQGKCVTPASATVAEICGQQRGARIGMHLRGAIVNKSTRAPTR